MNRSLIASLALAATALTFGAGAFAQTGSTAPIQKDVAQLKADKATTQVAHEKLHADKLTLKADKTAGNSAAVVADKATVANDKVALATDKKVVHADKKQLHADKKAALVKTPS
jgi:maltodextrin utilization protein YvdJ